MTKGRTGAEYARLGGKVGSGARVRNLYRKAPRVHVIGAYQTDSARASMSSAPARVVQAHSSVLSSPRAAAVYAAKAMGEKLGYSEEIVAAAGQCAIAAVATYVTRLRPQPMRHGH